MTWNWGCDDGDLISLVAVETLSCPQRKRSEGSEATHVGTEIAGSLQRK